MYTTRYFNRIYLDGRNNIKDKLMELQTDYPNYQYIFTGHSLGGAMATLFSLDSVLRGLIKKTDSSPVLITYASPRVGNYILAASVMYYVPIVFRIVNEGDPVTLLPPCSFIFGAFGACRNLNTLIFSQEKFQEKTASDKKFWHTGGLILYSKEMTSYINCGKLYSENNPDSDCLYGLAFSKDRHSIYLNRPVGKLCKTDPKKLFIETRKDFLKTKRLLNK